MTQQGGRSFRFLVHKVINRMFKKSLDIRGLQQYLKYWMRFLLRRMMFDAPSPGTYAQRLRTTVQ
jgi:hypothetical protein